MKRLNPEISVGFLLASLFWIGVLGWQSSYSPTERQKDECYETAKKTGYKADECKSFWERTTSDPIALFNLILAFSTVGLWVATIFLYRAGEKQIGIAKDAADSAKESAEAAIAVESARLLFFPQRHNYWEAVGQYANRWPNSPQMGALRNTVEACFVFKNYGKTPAILKEARAALEHRKEPPEMLGGSAPYLGLPIEQVIGQGLQTDEFKVEVPHFFTMAEAIAMSSDDGAIWLRGSVVYDDVFGREGTQWFIYKLNRTGGFSRFYEKSSYRKI
jgi:hypothetical protein